MCKILFFISRTLIVMIALFEKENNQNIDSKGRYGSYKFSLTLQKKTVVRDDMAFKCNISLYGLRKSVEYLVIIDQEIVLFICY